jgi:hypothetical protein
MAWLFVAVALGLGVGMFVWASARRRRGSVRLREAAPGASIGELAAGRFRVVGRIVPIQTTASSIDASPCVFVERAVYSIVGSELVPLLRQIDHVIAAHPFFVDDGTGRVKVDPAHAVIDTVTLMEDEGLLAERRLRAGEEIELVACFTPSQAESDGGPYRAKALTWEAVDDPELPPHIGFAAEQSAILATDDTTTFLRGIGAVLLVVAVVSSFLVAMI